MDKTDLTKEEIDSRIEELVKLSGGDPTSFEGDLTKQQIQTSLRLMSEGHNLGQLKLITRSLKEMRYAYRIFNEHPKAHRISIFGSARTPEDHPDYITAKAFSHAAAEKGWMCITGAAEGIMKAGLEGQRPEGKFGLSIRLPFEAPTNQFIEGDPKLISFRYFFTRKLMFMSHADAIAVFPGGFGTLDELFEMLTLIQTGKGNVIPIVLLEGEGGVYWHHWEIYVQKNLMEGGKVSPEDRNLYYIAKSSDEAIDHIQRFYYRYHSSRYVKDELVIRLSKPLTEAQVSELNQKFSTLIVSGKMRYTSALPEEGEYEDLPRLVFHHNRNNFGLLRAMLDAINAF